MAVILTLFLCLWIVCLGQAGIIRDSFDLERLERQIPGGNSTNASTSGPMVASTGGTPGGNGSLSLSNSASGSQSGNGSSSVTAPQQHPDSFIKPDSFIDPSFAGTQSGAGGSSAPMGSSGSGGGSNSSSSDASHGSPFQSPLGGGSQPFMPSFLDPSKFMLSQQQLGQGGSSGTGTGGGTSGTSLTGSGSTSGLPQSFFHPPSFFMNPSGGGQTGFNLFNPSAFIGK